MSVTFWTRFVSNTVFWLLSFMLLSMCRTAVEFRYMMIKANQWFGSCIYSVGAAALVTGIGGSSILGCICGLGFLYGSCHLIQPSILFWAIWPPAKLGTDFAPRALGAFAGCLTGPPCGTWSAARHLQLEECVGPRPLRSAELPWCLPTCTGKELRQATMGSELLPFRLRLKLFPRAVDR